MSQLTKKIRSRIKEHSLSEYPSECCGIIVARDKKIDVIKCKNIAFDKSNFFEIGPVDYLRASKRGKIKAYYHSHIGDSINFSGADKEISQSHKLPLIMYSIKENKFSEYSPI